MFQLPNARKNVQSLRSHLIQLTLAGVIPVLLFAGGLVAYLTHKQGLEMENNLRARARAVEVMVDEQMTAMVSGLQILTYTEDFSPEEFKQLHRKLSRAVEKMPSWVGIAVTDLNGNQLIHTQEPFGTKLPPVTKYEAFQRSIQIQKPTFSEFHLGLTTDRPVVSIYVPVIRHNKVTLVLRGVLSVEIFSKMLKQQKIPPDWSAAILDQNFTLIGRHDKAEVHLGKASPASTVKMLRQGESGLIRDKNRDGIESVGAFTRSKITGYTVIMGMEASKMNLFTNVFKIIVASAIFFIGLGVVLATYLGKKISHPIVALSHSAEAYGKGYISPIAVESNVEEVQILAKTMELASLQRIRSENSIRTLNEISSALSAELDLKKLLQNFTDLTTALVRAEFGAYFNMNSEKKEFTEMVTISGVPMEKFANFPMPGPTLLFGPTFRGEGVIRIDDLTQDPRYGKNKYKGIPPGHLPVKSYLAVSVVSRTGEVMGGLFFGHSRPGAFTEQDEKLISALAAQAATAIDNAILYTRATEAIEMRDTFLSVASHELKTPLTSIFLQFEILKRSILKNSQQDEKVLNLFERFSSQLERLTRLINELLDVTRIASGKMELHLEKVELHTLVKDICANFESEAMQKGSPITLNINSEITGIWDSGRIEQVLMNLVSNAIKYGNKQPIDVTVQTKDKWALVKITDRGLGIAPEDQGRIFQRFERAIDSNSISGLGLGLFICKEIVNRHGGDIKVESELGKGSTFILKLPLS